jgi:hypothetical protein
MRHIVLVLLLAHAGEAAVFQHPSGAFEIELPDGWQAKADGDKATLAPSGTTAVQMRVRVYPGAAAVSEADHAAEVARVTAALAKKFAGVKDTPPRKTTVMGAKGFEQRLALTDADGGRHDWTTQLTSKPCGAAHRWVLVHTLFPESHHEQASEVLMRLRTGLRLAGECPDPPPRGAPLPDWTAEEKKAQEAAELRRCHTIQAALREGLAFHEKTTGIALKELTPKTLAAMYRSHALTEVPADPGQAVGTEGHYTLDGEGATCSIHGRAAVQPAKPDKLPAGRALTHYRACFGIQKSLVGRIDMDDLDRKPRPAAISAELLKSVSRGNEDPGQGAGTEGHYVFVRGGRSVTCTVHGWGGARTIR